MDTKPDIKLFVIPASLTFGPHTGWYSGGGEIYSEPSDPTESFDRRSAYFCHRRDQPYHMRPIGGKTVNEQTSRNYSEQTGDSR